MKFKIDESTKTKMMVVPVDSLPNFKQECLRYHDDSIFFKINETTKNAEHTIATNTASRVVGVYTTGLSAGFVFAE